MMEECVGVFSTFFLSNLGLKETQAKGTKIEQSVSRQTAQMRGYHKASMDKEEKKKEKKDGGKKKRVVGEKKEEEEKKKS